jgi:single-stranded-DNA-specific exonuclease
VEAPPKRWKKRQQLKPDQIAQLQELLPEFRLSPLLLQLLTNRGVIHLDVLRPAGDEAAEPPTQTPETLRAAVAAFLNPATTPLPSPFLISGVEQAVERIGRALDSKEKIAVYGDYDADGVTSTALLTQALRAWGADVDTHVPHRKRDGYGVNKLALDSLAAAGVTLVVTVDCGVSNVDEVAHGQAQGLDLIVTDHHCLPGSLPNTIIINPRQDGEDGPFAHLTGVGVAHQVVRALVERRGKPPTLRNNDLLALVAIGAVADVAPLLGANRTLVALGLNCLRATKRPGLLALLEAAGVRRERVTAHTIGHVIAPRINAAGRLDDSRPAYDLLLTNDPAEAADLARRLESINARRRELSDQIQVEARKRVALLPQDEPIIILRDKDWDVGVVGLVAARLVESFGRPALVLCDEGEVSRGSGRAPRGYDLHEMLEACADLLGHWGGHAAAAGFSLPNANFEEFAVVLREMLARDDPDAALFTIDLQAEYELTLDRVNIETMAELQTLEPYGPGNMPAIFVARNLRVIDGKANGKDGNTLALALGAADGTGPTVRAVGFRMAQEWMPKIAGRPRVDAMFKLEADEWQGQQRVQMVLEGLRLSKE